MQLAQEVGEIQHLSGVDGVVNADGVLHHLDLDALFIVGAGSGHADGGGADGNAHHLVVGAGGHGGVVAGPYQPAAGPAIAGGHHGLGLPHFQLHTALRQRDAGDGSLAVIHRVGVGGGGRRDLRRAGADGGDLAAVIDGDHLLVAADPVDCLVGGLRGTDGHRQRLFLSVPLQRQRLALHGLDHRENGVNADRRDAHGLLDLHRALGRIAAVGRFDDDLGGTHSAGNHRAVVGHHRHRGVGAVPGNVLVCRGGGHNGGRQLFPAAHGKGQRGLVQRYAGDLGGAHRNAAFRFAHFLPIPGKDRLDQRRLSVRRGGIRLDLHNVSIILFDGHRVRARPLHGDSAGQGAAVEPGGQLSGLTHLQRPGGRRDGIGVLRQGGGSQRERQDQGQQQRPGPAQESMLHALHSFFLA